VERDEQTAQLEAWAASHAGIVFKVARAFARDRADQEDLVQEILYALWAALPTFRSDSNSATFVYRVAHNRALNWQRARRRYRQRVMSAERLGALGPAAPEDPETRGRLDRLYEGIRGLKPLDRTLVLLYLDELSYAAISGITGLSENHVGVRLSRIRQELARVLAERRGT
jgi:RNA polymerase sigma factor (sigma-70 family)